MAFPALKRRPPDFVNEVLDTVNGLVEADGRIDVFEYLLARIIALHLRESYNPHRVKVAGNRSLASCRNEILAVLAVVAGHGHDNPAEQQAAFNAGLESLPFGSEASMPRSDDWVNALDTALARLDRLKSSEKEKLVRALAGTVLHDGRLEPSELELLRAICDLIHVPLPILTA
jgi:hypothetical protein